MSARQFGFGLILTILTVNCLSQESIFESGNKAEILIAYDDCKNQCSSKPRDCRLAPISMLKQCEANNELLVDNCIYQCMDPEGYAKLLGPEIESVFGILFNGDIENIEKNLVHRTDIVWFENTFLDIFDVVPPETPVLENGSTYVFVARSTKEIVKITQEQSFASLDDCRRALDPLAKSIFKNHSESTLPESYNSSITTRYTGGSGSISYSVYCIKSISEKVTLGIAYTHSDRYHELVTKAFEESMKGN